MSAAADVGIVARPPDERPRAFSDAECARLASLGDPHGFVVRLLLGTGLRWAEACRATAADVSGGAIEVTQASGRRRQVPLPPGLQFEIGVRRGRLVPSAIAGSRAFAGAVRRLSGIADFEPRRCRDTFAVRWLAAGGSVHVLQQLLGDRDLATTMRYGRATEALALRSEAGGRVRPRRRELQ